MTQEDKNILLKDLCARLPYKPMIRLEFQSGHGYQIGKMEIRNFWDIVRHFENGIIATIKPYLRPMSSMTEEEQQKYYDLTHQEEDDVWAKCLFDKMVDFCNERHLDYRGLIEKGLALEAPKGMYKTK